MNFSGGDPKEGSDFSDAALNYINQILMEEDLRDETCMFQDSALQAAEKSFYDILGEKYTFSTNQNPPHENEKNPVGNNTCCCNYNDCNTCMATNNLNESSLICDLGEHEPSCILAMPVDCTFQSTLWSPCRPSGLCDTVDGLVDSPVNTPLVPGLFNEDKSVLQFMGGIKEAWKPDDNHMIIDFENSILIPLELNEKTLVVAAEAEKGKRDHSPSGLRERKHHYEVQSELERSNKHLAVYAEDSERSEMFDNVLLCNCDVFALCALDEALQNGPGRLLHQNAQSKGSDGRTTRRKRRGNRRHLVDLRTLLISCGEAVAGNDRRSATTLLMQIRQHSSPFGDGSQRLAHCFANALEARMAGTGSEVYATLTAQKKSAFDILKACTLFLSACPFMKMSNVFATQTIVKLAEKATRLHIIHFGILYGFQWPCLIQHLSTRPGGPPVLCITGIDLPLPGFQPAAQVEETGRRLANYCERFNVPFEYNAIAQNWETIQYTDLKIEEDELLVVICLYRFRHLLDETVVLDSPRDAVLNLIKRINPDIFIHGIINGAYNAPFFISRFREALYYFSSVFDMFAASAPCEDKERILFEEEIYGKEILNVIACEGSKRVERPETHKQWQVRNLRAGFRQLPLNQEIMKKVRAEVKSFYHKDFLVDVDGQWMLQGWKGRILFALSCWKAA